MSNKCPVCGMDAEIQAAQSHFGEWVKCKKCGVFLIEDNLINKLTLKTKACIYYYLSHNRQIDNIHEQKAIYPHFHNMNWEDGQLKDRIIISEKALLNLYPQSLQQKTDMILLNLADKIKYIGNVFTTYSSEEDKLLYPLFFIDDSFGQDSLYTQFKETLNLLQELNYVKHVGDLSSNKNTYTLTSKGWERVEKLQSENKDLPQCFIAMCFNSVMKEARTSIVNAITDCGYIPVIIDIKEHNNQIVPEIFYEIKRSKFIVADLSKHRNGVYYEAGFAEALEKQVILTCKKDDFEQRHFDVAQKNTIVWENESDLYTRLLNRIESTVGKRKA